MSDAPQPSSTPPPAAPDAAAAQGPPSGGRGAPARPPVALVHDAAYRRHDTGEGHPESAWRCTAIMARLAGCDFADRLMAIRAREATEEELLACHTWDYLRTVRRDVAAGMTYLSTGDTPIGPHSLAAALLAAGGVLAAVDAVVTGAAGSAFCAVRPPGHHATPTRGMGFCVFNNVAIAARYAQRAHGIGKVLIVDWDIHHGNGTQETFYEDPSVFYFSTHQWPWYPGSGSSRETGYGTGEGTTLNCPLPRGSGRKEVLGAFTDKLLPAAQAFRPEMVLISAGFDSRVGDPLGGFTLTDEDFADLTRLVLGIASQYAGGRVVSSLEGGYDLAGLASAAEAHCRALAKA